MTRAVNTLGLATIVGIVALLFANAYGCLVPENIGPYFVAMTAATAGACGAALYRVG